MATDNFAGTRAQRLSILAAVTLCALALLATQASRAAASVAGVVTKYSAGISANAYPDGITAGPDGNLWFSEGGLDRIGRITPAGSITEFSAGITSGAAPTMITAGPDANLWFTESGLGRVARITPRGTVTEFSAGITPGAYPFGITTGPDGNLWFTETAIDKVARITPDGVVSEFSVAPGDAPQQITAGPDGNLWFALSSDQIGRITPSGAVTLYAAGITAGAIPFSITTGPDANLWFTESGGNKIGRITQSGLVSEFSFGISPAAFLEGITTGPDANLWFTESSGAKIGRITPAGTVTEFSARTIPGSQGPDQITVGPDGSLWFTDTDANAVSKITSGVGPPLTATLAGSGQVGLPSSCLALPRVSGPTWTIASLAYQWLLDGSPITGATSVTYAPTAAQIDRELSCLANPTYWPMFNQTAAISNAVTVLANPRALSVSRSGSGEGTVNSAPGGINCGADCQQNFSAGTAVTLAATPANDSRFTGWTSSSTVGASCSLGPACTVLMSQTVFVVAHFAALPKPNYLSIIKGGSGTGTVVSSPAGINCGRDCRQGFAADTTVALTAKASSDSTFTRWSGACSASGACKVKMSQAHLVGAIFTKIPKPTRPTVTWSSIQKTASVNATVTPVSGVSYAITAKGPKATRRGLCKSTTINRAKKERCTITLTRGTWLVSITPKKGSVVGTTNDRTFRF